MLENEWKKGLGKGSDYCYLHLFQNCVNLRKLMFVCIIT